MCRLLNRESTAPNPRANPTGVTVVASCMRSGRHERRASTVSAQPPHLPYLPYRSTGGLRHLVLTRPETEPSMRFLSVGSHLCARASFGPPLAGLPLPSASSCMCPTIRHYRYSYRGLSPHKFMSMSGVHEPMKLTVACGAAAYPRAVGRTADLPCRVWGETLRIYWGDD
jgi:hypothetical protein